MKKIPALFFMMLSWSYSFAQASEQLSIEECYQLAQANYPLVKQRELISKSRDYTIDNIGKGFLPQLSFAGQATYQSEVPELPFRLPGENMELISRDQYRIYAEVNQTVYDGGAIRQTKQVQETNALIEEQKLEVELYKLKERINQLFFGILIIEEQKVQVALLKKDLQSGLRKVEAAIENGAALRSAADVLRAELLTADQRSIELNTSRQAFAEMLSMFINKPVDEHTMLLKPEGGVAFSEQINRPELQLFAYQKQNLEHQYQLSLTRNAPKAGMFLQGGYGRPGLNFLRNEFRPYYIGGIRFSWGIGGLYTLSNDRQLLELGQRTVEVQQEAFLFNTSLNLKQQNSEIRRLQELVRVDQEIIALRANVKHSAMAQLENGVITSHDYLREVNAEDRARQNLLIHQVQLLLAQYQHQAITGN